MTAPCACESCGSDLLANARFCHACGASIERASRPAEYKQVTVLFADVVQSMTIAAAVGEERLREIMSDLVNRAGVVVQRYGGTIDKFTGDGLMAVFGAPLALEDHALRACLAALGIQEEVKRLAIEIDRRDGVVLHLRIGLNSGRVIAGDVGSHALGYTAIGEQVGVAQRMESVAPAGGVLLSESTARLVRHGTVLSEPELVTIKGVDHPVPAWRLHAIAKQEHQPGRPDSTFVGRQREIDTVADALNRSISGLGCVVSVSGPPGIGKTRLVRETAESALQRGAEVFSTFCESHAGDIPFHAMARLLRAVVRVVGLDADAARARVRARLSAADPQDIVLLDDLLGIRDAELEMPRIDPDARRRRLTALIKTIATDHPTPALYITEDVHWIDEVSESMLVDFAGMIPQNRAMVLITSRPEYRGALLQLPDIQTVTLGPLSDSKTLSLIRELLGSDPSVRGVAALIAESAAGNPFFAQEMVRDLTERGVLEGDRGAHVCRVHVAEIHVPATLQAVISARIDRLPRSAKQVLGAASVIGSRFSTDLLSELGINPVLTDLVAAELIDEVKFGPRAEFAFRHPLIRTVAYESQLKSDRAALHRRLAVIEAADLASADENAAVIAEHLEAAGDVSAAYSWHMRAGRWAAMRDIVAARVHWERARQIADALPADSPDHTEMRIAPRTLLCGNSWRIHANISSARFEELRQLCALAGDQASLAIGMAGLVNEHMMRGRVLEGAQLASECMGLIESVGDPDLIVGLSFATILAKCETGEIYDALQWSQRVIDLAGGDSTKGNIILGSPLAVALAYRGLARWAQGYDGWREDFKQAVEIGRSTDPMSHAFAVNVIYSPAITWGLLPADDTALRDIDEALHIAERLGDDMTVGTARMALGLALVHRDSRTDRERGLEVLAQLREMCLQNRFNTSQLAVIDVYAASARPNDRDSAIARIRAGVQDLFRARQFAWCILATGVLVENLLLRGSDTDVREAEKAIDTMAAIEFDHEYVARDILLLRLRALHARAIGDPASYRDLVTSYRALADSSGFEAHRAMAATM
ncbi:cyclase [Mycobacterium sp. 1164966.3]|uniref:adenylate/guanylate cyclase domain-containing protein n=1 Tax=Mycobacterium sp. 1164966.3 TaxID=1856861 RepID=UPI0007FB8CE6|nr:adenylate/guanylate cyclase domain-containing protein [Mycobacterium sp. 1164966.3]OBA83731.1 cyclase [Mycobacterium sp. 1164966.3]